jgi:hypothetical protein
MWVGKDVFLQPIRHFRDRFRCSLLEVGNSSMKSVGFAYQEELHKKCRGTLVPCVDSFLVLVEPLFFTPQEGEWK